MILLASSFNFSYDVLNALADIRLIKQKMLTVFLILKKLKNKQRNETYNEAVFKLIGGNKGKRKVFH